jgi:hypothetical protein
MEVVEELPQRIQVLAREALTWIELQESEAVQFGIVEASTRGSEVITQFRGRPVAGEPCTQAEVLRALRVLRDDEQLVVLGVTAASPGEPAGWTFRSRMGELVRLLMALRQRFPNTSITDAPALVADLVWDVRPRRYPERNIELTRYLTSLPVQQGGIVQDALTRYWEGRSRRSTNAVDIEDEQDESADSEFAFSGFQERAMQMVSRTLALEGTAPEDARGLVIEAGTGSGKTFSFFLPLFGYLVHTRIQQSLPGCKVICAYPRQPLAENQFQAMVDLLYHLNRERNDGRTRPLPYEKQVRIGLLYARVPYGYRDPSEFKHRYRNWGDGPRPNTFVAPFVRCPVCRGDLIAQPTLPGDAGRRLVCVNNEAGTCGAGETDLAYIRYARSDYLGGEGPVDPPDVFLAVTESLNDALASTASRSLFGRAEDSRQLCVPQFLMLDEIHLQTGSKGMQVGYLLRRLMARLQENRGAQAHGLVGYGHPDQPRVPLVVAGLSATIHQGEDFFSRLVGIQRQNVTRVAPDDASGELISGDAEHLLFVKAEDVRGTLSSLIQTTMLLVHGYPQPPTDAPAYRTFGFADSLDLVNRWERDQKDSERQNLFRLRLPNNPDNARAYLPSHLFGCETCLSRNYPEPTCIAHQMGECWWPVQAGGLLDSLRIDKTSSQTETFDRRAHVVMATSKLEVGYDDDQLMLVVQYLAPRDLASFVQRKGRGGRQIGTRPIMATLLSPARPADLFYFRNPQLLTDPTFRRLPLNPANALARQIHAAYGFLDWVSNRAEQAIDLRALNSAAWDEVRRQAATEAELDTYRDYLGRIFGLDAGDPAVIRALVDDTRGLYGAILVELQQAVRAQNFGESKDLSDLLPRRIPPTLFSDIHLPLVRIYSDEGDEFARQGLDIDQALSEFVPGRVSLRYHRHAWIPIDVEHLTAAAGARPAALDIEDVYTASGPRWDHQFGLNWRDVPDRLRRRLGASSTLGSIPIYRPYTTTVKTVFRGVEGRDGRMYDSDTPRWVIDQSEPAVRPAGDRGVQFNERSRAFAIRFTQVEPPRPQSFPPQSRFQRETGAGGKALVRDIGRLFSEVRFAVSSEGLALSIRRSVVGTEYALLPKRRRDSAFRAGGVAAFVDHGGQWVGLGYGGRSDGVEFDLTPDWHGGDGRWVTSERERILRSAVFRYEVIQRILAAARPEIFSLERLIEAALAYLGSDADIAGAEERCLAFERADASAVQGIHDLVDGLFQEPAAEIRQGVDEVMADDRTRVIIATTFRDTLLGGARSLLLRYREDILRHTLKHALKAAVRLLSGAAEQGEIAGQTDLQLDFPAQPGGQERPIYIFEVGLEGVGMVQALYDDMRKDPAPFFHVLGDLVERCETAREETWLLDVLRREPADLLPVALACRAAIDAVGVQQRRERVDAARSSIATLLGNPVDEWMLRSAFRILGARLLLPGAEPIPEWLAYREVNIVFLGPEEERLQRPLSSREARYRLRLALDREPGRFPTLQRLRLALAAIEESGNLGETLPESDENDLEQSSTLPAVVRRLERLIERRLLISCRTACPSCLQDQECDVDPSSRGTLLLDRHLLVALLDRAREAEVVEVADNATHLDVIEQVHDRFERASHEIARLRYKVSTGAAVSAALQQLFAEGLEVELRPRRIGHLGDRRFGNYVEILLELV